MRVFTNFDYKPLQFQSPRRIIRCQRLSEVNSCFDEMEKASAEGYWLAGFLSYEAGYAFEPCFMDHKSYDFPLLCFGVYEQPQPFCPFGENTGAGCDFSGLGFNTLKSEYYSRIQHIRREIERGEVYQITYCIKLKFGFKGDPRHLYRRLFNEQPVPYSAYIESDDGMILSLSPERFLVKEGGRILSEPMKGTWPRGRNPVSDVVRRTVFARDAKNRAENVMIADLLRNDLGRIGQNIQVPQLFRITPYKTLFQMTSIVTADVLPAIPFRELFAAAFPSGSVTGAPRLRAMDIIRGLEREDRRIYTGGLGFITPGRDMYFNIPIRTLLLRDGAGEMGIGGGIVWDSTPQGEWAEGLLKASFMADLRAWL